MSSEAKVGLLVIVVALLAVSVAVYLSGALRDFGAYTVVAQFADVQGLTEGAPVRFGGVDIGRVTRVRLREHPSFPNRPAAVTMKVEPEAVLYETDSFNIKQGALVGDKYLSISRPPDVEEGRRIADSDVVGGGAAASTEIIMDEMRDLIAEARVSVDAVNLLLTDVELHESMRGTIGNLNQATAQAVVISERAVELVDTVARAGAASEQRIALIMSNLVVASESITTSMERIDTMIATSPLPGQMAMAGDNLRIASQNIEAMSASALETIETSTIPEESEAAVANIREATEHLREMSETAARFADDEQMAEDIRSSLANVRQATDSLRTASEQIEELVTDEEMTDDLRVTVRELRHTAEAGRGTMEQAQQVMTDVEGTMEAVRATQRIITDIETRPRFELRAIEGRGVRADASFDLRPSPESPHFWRLGLRDIEGPSRLDLQYAREHGANLGRVGIMGGELGIGYDWRHLHGSGVEVDLYDLSSPRLDLRWRLTLQREYKLLLGAERALSGTHPMLGIRYKSDF